MIFANENVIIEVLKLVCLIIVTYFFMQILTNKKRKVSIVGTMLVSFSTFVANRGANVAIIAGEAFIIALYQILISDKIVIKMIFTTLLGLFAGMFIGYKEGFYDGLEIALFYTYLAIALWIILENRKSIKIDRKTVLFLVPCIIISIILFIFIRQFYTTQLKYSRFISYTTPSYNPETKEIVPGKTTFAIPDKRDEQGLKYLMSHSYSIFLLFGDMERVQSNFFFSGFLSFFPLPLIWAMMYVCKKEKHTDFLVPMVIVITLESIFCMTKLSIFKYLGFSRDLYIDMCSAGVGLSCIYLYMYMIAHIEENIFSTKVAIRITLVLLVLDYLVPKPACFNTKGYMYAIAALISAIYYLFINLGDKRYKRVLLVVLAMWSIITILPIGYVTYKYYHPFDDNILIQNAVVKYNNVNCM